MTEPQSFELSPQDQHLLDALVDCGFNVDALEALPPQERKRADALVSLLDLLEDYPVEDADDTLVHATLARIDQHEDERAARMAFDNQDTEDSQTPRRRFRVPDFISVAAVILIGASVVWPVTTHLRHRAIDAGCANNLRFMAMGFGQYANDFDGVMPTARAGVFGAWTQMESNLVNLKPLLAKNYCEIEHLNCPGHDSMYGESYSYQWQVQGVIPRWGTGARITVVLGDRNPVIDAVKSGRVIDAGTISLNHPRRGQNVLTSGGVVLWLR